MLKRPVFRPHLRVEVVAGEGVFVLSESRQTVLQGRLFEVVAPQLDGAPVEDLCRRLAPQAPPSQVFFTLRKLEERGFICEQADELPPNEAAYWAMQGLEPPLAAERFAAAAVALDSLGVDREPLLSLLQAADLRVADDGQFQVVVADHYLNRGLAEINRRQLAAGRPWLLVKPLGAQVWIGPLFQPGQTGCWECLAQRIRSNFPIVGYLANARGDQHLPWGDSAQTPATASIAWGLAANAIAGWIAHGEAPLLAGKVQTFDTLSWRSQSHTLLKQPSCASCGAAHDANGRVAARLILQSRRKTYTEDGGHRVLTPQETLDKYSHHVSPICGAVTMLERWAPADDGEMHVYISGNNIARGPESLLGLRGDLRNSSCGKGVTELQAKASALCEGLERYCGIFRGDEPRRRARLADLGDAAIDPRRCLLFSDRQYAERVERNRSEAAFGYVPLRFDPEQEIEWTPVWSLTHDAERFLPTAFCYFSYPHDCRYEFCVADSNGNAAGNSLEEAILQGFFELVERDAVSLWWYNRLSLPGIDLDGFGEPYIPRLRSFFKSKNRNLWALDLTTDLGIPAVAAVSQVTAGPREQLMFGFGAHLDPRIAMLRAVTELNQFLTPLMETRPDGSFVNLTDEDTLRWVQTAKLAEHGYLAPRAGPLKTAADYPRTWTDDLKEDVLLCRSSVERLGLEMLVLDQTRPEIGLPVVKVTVPGLRHFWTRFAPGRLYDTPVQLGWLNQPTPEEQLNPVPMFL